MPVGWNFRKDSQRMKRPAFRSRGDKSACLRDIRTLLSNLVDKLFSDLSAQGQKDYPRAKVEKFVLDALSGEEREKLFAILERADKQVIPIIKFDTRYKDGEKMSDYLLAYFAAGCLDLEDAKVVRKHLELHNHQRITNAMARLTEFKNAKKDFNTL